MSESHHPRLHPQHFDAACHQICPTVSQPRPVGVYSIKGEEVVNSEANLSFCPPWPDADVRAIDVESDHPGWDLNKNFCQESDNVEEQKDCESVLGLHRTLRAVLDSLSTDTHLLDGVTFVSCRNPLNHLAEAVYERRSGFVILATRFQGVNYIHRLPPPNDMNTDLNLRPMYWGRQFERIVTYRGQIGRSNRSNDKQSLVKRWQTPNMESNLDADCELCVLFRTNISPFGECGCSNRNKIRLLYMAEMDGCFDGQSEQSEGDKARRFLELKTSQMLTRPGQEANFYRYKARRTWIQSYLGGVEDVIYGFRDNSGCLHYLERIPTRTLARESVMRGFWSPALMLHSLVHLLSFVEKQLVDRESSSISSDGGKFSESPQLLRITRNPNALSIQIEVDERGQSFLLPAWFTEHQQSCGSSVCETSANI